MTVTPAASPASRASSGDARQLVFRVVLRKALPPSVLAGVVTAVVLGLVSGLTAGVSAVVGVVIATAFFASGLLVMAKFVTDTREPLLFLSVGMATYFAQVIVLFGVLIAARRISAFDSRSAGVAIAVCVVVWQVAQLLAWRSARVPVYDAVSLPGEPSEGSSAPTRVTSW